MAFHRDKVFVAGGEPTITYVQRAELHVEKNLARGIASPNQIVSLSGPSKSGKTVLCKRVLGEREYVWVEGGQLKTADDLWNAVSSELRIPTETKISETKEGAEKIDTKVLIVTASGSKLKRRTEDRTYNSHTMSDALQFLIRKDICLVIDDFHYLGEDARTTVMRNIKGAVFQNLKVVLLSVAHRSFDAIKAEVELTGRFSTVELPEWSQEDLSQIAVLGCAELGVSIKNEFIAQLADEAQGSPFLMQKFCWEVCYDLDIEKRKLIGKHVIPTDYNMGPIFKEIAKDAGLPMYKKIVGGPQSRKIRIKRPLSTGEEADIYEVILLAIAETGPKSSIPYDELRLKLTGLLADRVPQKHEITSSLKQIAKISGTIGTDTIIDWDEDGRTINIADPYLRFYLRWQVSGKAKSSDIQI